MPAVWRYLSKSDVRVRPIFAAESGSERMLQQQHRVPRPSVGTFTAIGMCRFKTKTKAAIVDQ